MHISTIAGGFHSTAEEHDAIACDDLHVLRVHREVVHLDDPEREEFLGALARRGGDDAVLSLLSTAEGEADFDAFTLAGAVARPAFELLQTRHPIVARPVHPKLRVPCGRVSSAASAVDNVPACPSVFPLSPRPRAWENRAAFRRS